MSSAMPDLVDWGHLRQKIGVICGGSAAADESECLDHCSQLPCSAPVASRPLPAPTNFTGSHSQAVEGALHHRCGGCGGAEKNGPHNTSDATHLFDFRVENRPRAGHHRISAARTCDFGSGRSRRRTRWSATMHRMGTPRTRRHTHGALAEQQGGAYVAEDGVVRALDVEIVLERLRDIQWKIEDRQHSNTWEGGWRPEEERGAHQQTDDTSMGL